MEPLFRVRCSSWLRTSMLFGALALHACDSGFVPVSVPAQQGGLPPVEGSDLLDTSFAGTGVFESGAFVERQPVRVSVDRFSRPLIVGIGSTGRFASGLRVLRLTEAGTSDATFGTDGSFYLPNNTTETVTYTPRAPDLLIDASERIWVFSTRHLFIGGERAVVMRLEPDGALDTSFGDQGRVVLEPTSLATETQAVSLHADSFGGFLACANELGLEGSRMIVVRFDEHGTLDGDFGEGGIARGPEDEASVGVRAVLGVAGRTVVAGTLPTEPGRVALWCFDAQGARDPGFGVDGFVTESDRNTALGVEAVDASTDATGRIVLLGQRARDLPEIYDWPTQLVDFQDTAPVFDAIVWSFLPDGSPDTGFADGCSKVLAFNSGPYYLAGSGLMGGDHFDAAAGLFLDEVGRIVIAGWSDPAEWDRGIGFASFGPTRPFLIRLTSSGALDLDFHGIGHAQIGWDAHTFATAFMLGHPTSITRDVQGRWVLGGGNSTGGHQLVWRVVP